MNSTQIKIFAQILLFILVFTSCNKDEEPTSSPNIIFKFKFDPDQERLGNFGESQSIPSSHAAQTPTFNMMGAHYIELSKKDDIPAYNGTFIYESPVTNNGGTEAIDFEQALYAGDGEVFYSTELNAIPPGKYEFLRISLSYQNYTINFRAQNLDLTGTIASFVGANTYIDSYEIKNETVTVNGNKLQGYWAFETDEFPVPIVEGQAPGTTVTNPIHDSSPIPAGSCLVTGKFETPFEITGNETSDIVIICSISINNSFEWMDNNSNGTYEPTEGDMVVDMGVRGLIPIVE